MPQDAFTLQFISKRLGELFTGGKISKINQPSKDALSLLVYTKKGTVKLDIDLSAKFCRISAGEGNEYENPAVCPNFCMLLRKHLQNAEITAVEQDGFERVVHFDFNCFSEFEVTKMRLYLEIMGKYSNAVLTKDGIILGALKTASLETGAKRVTLSGARYKLPERQDKADPTSLEELEKAFLNASGDRARFIADNVAGISFVTAEDAVAKYGQDIGAQSLYDFVNNSTSSPCVVYRNGQPSDFKAIYSEGATPYPDVLEAQAVYYFNAVQNKKFADEKRRLLSALSSAKKKNEKLLSIIYDRLQECASADAVKLKGELITANIYAVQRGQTRLEAVNYYDENGGTVVIDLDSRLTPAANAQRYYKKYAKLKRAAEIANGQKAVAERWRDYLKSIESNLSLAEDMRDLKETEEELISLSLLPPPQKVKGKKVKTETPFRTFEKDGFTILCGRNNGQNDRLLKRLSPNDLWLHVKAFHSSHVAVVADGRQIPDEVIKIAARICARYSEAGEKDKVAVDYTLRKFVKKPNGAAAGFVIYTDFETILVAPDAHAELRCGD